MRIAILVTRNYGYSWLIHQLINRRTHDRFAVFETTRLVRGKKGLGTAWYLLRKSCLTYLVCRAAEALVIGLLSRSPLWRLNPFMRAFDLDWVCQSHGIPHVRIPDLFADVTTARRIRDFQPELLMSLTAQRIRKPLFGVAPKGIINVHLGRLPEYRGIAPYVWALSQGRQHLGVSVHRIGSESLDTGDLVGVRNVVVPVGTSIAGAFLRCVVEASRVVSEILDQISDDCILGEKQQKGTYYGWPKGHTMRALRKRGYRWFGISDLWRTIGDCRAEEAGRESICESDLEQKTC